MANSWIGGVKSTGQLTYHLDASVRGPWLTVFGEAITKFNEHARRLELGVSFAASADPPTVGGGANVGVATGSGSISYSYEGTRTTSINGTGLTGSTLLISREGSPIEKAFMFLPERPRINTPSAGLRPTGAGVMLVIAVHELIHACGLANSDHTAEDVFNGYPSADPGRTPDEDRIQISVGGRYRFMPPIIFSGATAGKIKPLWR